MRISDWSSDVCSSDLPAQDGDGKDRGNILFFGHFADMEEAAFIAAVKARLRTEEDIYETILRDTWQNGVVLARRKYRYLAYAYRLFVVGLTLTLLPFAAEMAMAWMGRSEEPTSEHQSLMRISSAV